VDGSAASEAVQILSALSQQGGDVGAVLGSAGAAEAIVRASLVNEDVAYFKSHKYGISDTITTSWVALLQHSCIILICPAKECPLWLMCMSYLRTSRLDLFLFWSEPAVSGCM